MTINSPSSGDAPLSSGRRVLVLGANGFAGSAIVGGLAAAGVEVVAATRPGRDARLRELLTERDAHTDNPQIVEWRGPGADLPDDAPTTIVVALPPAVQPALAQHLARLATASELRVVAISSTRLHSGVRDQSVGFVQQAEAAWTGSGLDVVILRPTMLVDLRNDLSLARIAKEVAAGRRMLFPGFGLADLQPFVVADLAVVIARLLDRWAEVVAAGRSFDLAGPDRFTLADFARRLADSRGLPTPQFLPVPAPMMALAGRAVIGFSRLPLIRRFVGANSALLAAASAARLTEDRTIAATPLLELLDVAPTSPLDLI